MRTCTKCNEPKELSEFSFKNKSKGTLSSECKECHRVLRQDYYRNNKQEELARVRDFKKKYVEWFKELKSKLVCKECQESHPATLQFHHLDPNEKEIGIADAITRKWSKNKVLREIEKCDVLCGNCHLKLHWNEDNQCGYGI